MPMYQARGALPPKRHTQFRHNDKLLYEEVFGLEGFSGNESILYHLNIPCQFQEIGQFEPFKHNEWIPERHVHHHFKTATIPAQGDAVNGRRVLMWNSDVEIALCHTNEVMSYFYRNGEGDELIFVHEGNGILETMFGDLPYREGDYLVIPRGTIYRFAPNSQNERYLVFTAPSLIEIPRRYRNEYGQLLEHAPYYHRDIHPPTELKTHTEGGNFTLRTRVRNGFQNYRLNQHPFDLVGWDGYVYAWSFNISDFEPSAKQVHIPPTAHQTFEAHNFVICSFCPRPLDFHSQAMPIPYYHSNLNSEEMLYYVAGNFASRKGIESGSITLHPSGVPHGPQYGLWEKAADAHITHTDELAVMCDTFRPLHYTTFAQTLDQPEYPYSWQAK